MLPGVLGDLGKLLDNDSDNKSIMLMILLVVLALIGGFMTTFAIVKHTAYNHRLLVNAELAEAKANL